MPETFAQIVASITLEKEARSLPMSLYVKFSAWYGMTPVRAEKISRNEVAK